MSRPPPSTRDAYRWFRAITTRWADNDVFGHVNNVVYYAWIGTAVTGFLVERGVLDMRASPVICVVAETGCRYFSEIAFPEPVAVGVRVASLGRSSVRYEVGVFRGSDETAAADGHFVHVYVDRVTLRPVPIPDAARAAMSTLEMPASQPA